MSDLRDASRAVLTELDVIRDHRERSGVGYLVVHVDTHEDLRRALAATPETVDAAEHDAGTCPSCGSAYCVGRLDYLDCVAVAMAEFVAARMDHEP